ncbi:hypothetical protein O8C79_06115 [Aliarcobacter butzleri]|uniref:hypothetical protein n=1 Tax=Aliarcobacter butzleri TaxID=28197 RepID=UPI00263E492A|nr:hypothetical protein [Aliarcobacter butzleri]MDN5104865.1 hypothetical protein [Aliarcobacter butzleri]
MKNSFKINGTFLTAVFFIIVGILTIIDPGYVQAKWGPESSWVDQLMIGGGYIIIGSIVAIVQGVSIYKGYKKDKE